LPALPFQLAYARRRDGLRVIESSAEHQNDGRDWYHVSFSYPDRLPNWEATKEVKALFVGDERTAVQIFPPRKQWVNIHPFCLHLWCCLSEDIIPEMAVAGSI